jgi:hypothetical protein
VRWLTELWRRRRCVKPWSTVSVVDLPDALDRRSVYLVGEAEHEWCVAMLCPCACGALIQLSLLAGGRPRWRYRLHEDRTLSLFPSVWRTIGCKSHFHVKRGQIIWHNDKSQLDTRTETILDTE